MTEKKPECVSESAQILPLAFFNGTRAGLGGRIGGACPSYIYIYIYISGHRAHRAQGMAIAKRDVGGLLQCCRSFKPFPSKLVYSRFPPGSGLLRPVPNFLQWFCSRAFSTCQTGRHRRCPKRVPEGLQEVIQRAQEEPPDHRLSALMSVLRTREKRKTKEH